MPSSIEKMSNASYPEVKLSEMMPAYQAYLESPTKWSVKTILIKTADGSFYVNLSSTAFKPLSKNIAEKYKLHVVTGAVASVKKEAVFIIGRDSTSSRRTAVALNEFMAKVKCKDILTKLGLIAHPQAVPIDIDNEFSKIVFGMVVVHDETVPITDMAYIFESELCKVMSLSKDKLSKMMVDCEYNWFRSASKDFEKAYTLKDVLTFIFTTKSQRLNLGDKVESFIDGVCGLVKTKSSAVLIENGEIKASLDDASDLMTVKKSSHPNMTKASEKAQKKVIEEKTQLINQLADKSKEDILSLTKVASEDGSSDDDIVDSSSDSSSETSLVVIPDEVKTFARKDFLPTLYVQSASCIANYPNRIGNASDFITKSAGCELPMNFNDAVANNWNLYWAGETTKPKARFSQHCNDANKSGHCKLTNHSEYHFMPLHHSALTRNSIIELESEMHKTIRNIPGVWMSNVSGFVIDKNLSNANMTELVLVAPYALALFHTVIRTFANKVGNQTGVIDILKKPDETYGKAINRLCIDRFQPAMETMVEKVAVGISGIVANMSSTTNNAIGLVDKAWARIDATRAEAKVEIDATKAEAKVEIAEAKAEANMKVAKAEADAKAATAKAEEKFAEFKATFLADYKDIIEAKAKIQADAHARLMSLL